MNFQINYENKENQYGTPIRSKSNDSINNKAPLSPLSPQPMMLSPNQERSLKTPLSPLSPNEKMVLSPPKQHHLPSSPKMGPPPSIPLKRPTSNLFEYVSKQITTNTTLNNSTFITTTTPSPQPQIQQAQQVDFTFPVPQMPTSSTISKSNNNTLNRRSAQQLKTFSKIDEEDQFSTRKREDRKSSQLLRQSSKRDMLIQASRQLNQQKSPPKQQQTIITEEEQRILDEKKQQQLQEFLSKEKKRIESIKEVYTSEYTYVGHLNTIIEQYLLPLRKEYTTPEEVRFIVSIFSNIESIRKINQTQFLDKVKDRIASIGSSTSSLIISDLFLSIIPSLSSIYIEYYVNYYRSLNSLDVWFSKCKKFRKFLDGDSMILKSLLIMPVQRIPRYSLLLDAVIRFTSPTHPDYFNLLQALDKMKSLTENINEQVRRSEGLQKITNIKFKFNDTIGFLDQTHRVLIKDSGDGTLKLQPYKSVNVYNNNNNNVTIGNNIEEDETNSKESDDLTDEEDYSGGNNLILNSSFKRSLSSKTLKKSSSIITLVPSDCALYLFNDTLLLGTKNKCEQQDERDQITGSGGNIINNSNNNNSNSSGAKKYSVVLKSNLVETFIKDYPKLAPTIFSIHHNSGTYLISTQTVEQREIWVKEINDTINKLIGEPNSELSIRRSKISLKGTDEYGWYAFDTCEPHSQDTNLISRSLQELEKNQIFTPKKRKSTLIGKVKQRMSSFSSPHKNQNSKRNSSFVLNSLDYE